MSQSAASTHQEFDVQQLEALLTQDYVGVAILRGPEYIVERANDLLCRIWGRQPGQVMGRYLFEILPEIKSQGFDDLLRGTYTTGKPYIGTEMPVRLIRDGQEDIVYFNFSYHPIRDISGTIVGLVVLATDATEQVASHMMADNAQAEAEEGRHRLQRLFMQAPALVAVLRGPEHVFELANPRYIKTAAAGRNIVGLPVAQAFPEVVGQGFIEILDNVYRTGEPFEGNEIEIDFDRSDGRRETLVFNFIYQPVFDAAGKIESIFVHAVDVTDQVAARRASEALTTQLEAIYESMPDGLLIAHPGGITKINPTALGMLGFDDVAEIKDVQTMFNATNVRYASSNKPVAPGDSALARALRGERLQYEVILTNRKTGQDRIFRVAAAPLFDAAGTVTSAISVMTDITERKQIERQKDDFIGIATHELKTPVTSMKTYAQLLQRRFKKAGDATSAGTMDKIIGQINKLTGLIGDLLDVTKIDAGKLQIQNSEVKFDQLVKDVVETMQLTASRHELIIRGSTGLTVRTDPDRVEQVLINLISNAIKYSPRAHKVEIELSAARGQVQVRVRDFGIGIAPEKQEQVFERFYRVSGPQMESFPGLGLGLFISAEIIKRLGGRIWVESDGRTGSVFCFKLPKE